MNTPVRPRDDHALTCCEVEQIGTRTFRHQEKELGLTPRAGAALGLDVAALARAQQQDAALQSLIATGQATDRSSSSANKGGGLPYGTPHTPGVHFLTLALVRR